MSTRVVLGPRRCGKSLSVEREVAQGYARRIYFGTLWHDSAFTALIDEHRRRRNGAWLLVESQGNCSRDLVEIERRIGERENETAVVVDGLTTWAVHCSRNDGDVLRAAREIGYRLVASIAAKPRAYWNVVDVCPEVFREEDSLLGHAAAGIHETLRLHVDDLVWEIWR